MSSDEKALEKGNVTIHELGFGHDGYGIEKKGMYSFLVRADIEDLKDLHSLLSELLDTHTVKEEHRLSFYKGDEVWKCECGGDWRHDAFGGKKNTPSDKKEEKGCCDYCIGGGDHLRCPCHKKKEEPTTPEKNCCGCFGKPPISLGITLGGGEFLCQCKCHQVGIRHVNPECPGGDCDGRHGEIPKKLPTSSYEVTCGRCEKSIKHSCGRL